MLSVAGASATARSLVALIQLFVVATHGAQRRVISAEGYRDPLVPGCWGCNGNPGATLGQWQYGVANEDSQSIDPDSPSCVYPSITSDLADSANDPGFYDTSTARPGSKCAKPFTHADSSGNEKTYHGCMCGSNTGDRCYGGDGICSTNAFYTTNTFAQLPPNWGKCGPCKAGPSWHRIYIDDPCVDLNFTTTLPYGGPSVVMVVSTEEPNPTTASYGWSWQTSTTELVIYHQDPGFKVGWYYIGIICQGGLDTPCPAYYGLQVTVRTGFNVRQGQHSLSFGPHGSTSKLKIKGLEQLNSKTFSVELWAKLTKEFCPEGDPCAGGWTIFDNSEEFALKILQFIRPSDGSKYGKLVVEYGGNLRLSTSFEPKLNTWFHVCSTYDFQTEQMRIYANAEFLRQTNVIIRRMAGLDIFVGGPMMGNLGMDGNVDELRIWDHVRSDQQIARDWQLYYGEAKPGLMGYWRFNEGYGPYAYSIVQGLGQKIIFINSQPFAELDLYKGVMLGVVDESTGKDSTPVWAPADVYSASSTVTTAGGTTHSNIVGDTPKLWPEFPDSLWDNPQLLDDGKVLWQEICVRNFSDWRVGINLTLTSRQNADRVELFASHVKGPDQYLSDKRNLVYGTMRNFRYDTAEGRSMKLHPASEPQLQMGVVWLALSTKASKTQRQFVKLQTHTYQIEGCPDDCNHNGVCIAGQCSCYVGFAGVSCLSPVMVDGSPHCANNCTGMTVCLPLGYRQNPISLIKNGLVDPDFAGYSLMHASGDASGNSSGNGTDSPTGFQCICLQYAKEIKEFPNNKDGALASNQENVRCPGQVDQATSQWRARSDCPADFTCKGIGFPSGVYVTEQIICLGKTTQYCCTGSTAAACAGSETFMIQGQLSYFWGCERVRYFSGLAITLVDQSVLYLNSTLGVGYVNVNSSYVFNYSFCFALPFPKCAQGNFADGSCECYLGYEGANCTHGPFVVRLREGVPAQGEARCSVQQGQPCPWNAYANIPGYHLHGVVAAGKDYDLPSRSYRVSQYPAPTATLVAQLPPAPPVRTYSYFTYEYTNPCRDLTITVTTRRYSKVAALEGQEAGRASFMWRMNTPNMTFDEYSVLARNQPTERSVTTSKYTCQGIPDCRSDNPAFVETMFISHRDVDLYPGTLDVAVFCTENAGDCPADFSIVIEESSEDRGSPGLLDMAKVPLESGDVFWYEICVKDPTQGLEIEAHLKRGTKAPIPFVVSPILPSSIYGDEPSRVPTVTEAIQTKVMGPVGLAKEALYDYKFNWNAMWSNYDFTTNRLRDGGKMKFCGAEPGFKSGPLYVGIIAAANNSDMYTGTGAYDANIYSTTLQWQHQKCRKDIKAGDVVNGFLANGDTAAYFFRVPNDTEKVDITLNVYESQAELWVSELDSLPGPRGFTQSSYNASRCQEGAVNCTYVTPTRYQVQTYPSALANSSLVNIGGIMVPQMQEAGYQVAVTCKEGRACNAKFSMEVKLTKFASFNYTRLDKDACNGGCNIPKPPIVLTYCSGLGAEPSCRQRIRVVINTTQILAAETQALKLTLHLPSRGASHIFVSRTMLGGIRSQTGTAFDILSSGSIDSEAWNGHLVGTKQTPAWRWLSAQKKGNPLVITLSKDSLQGFVSGKYYITLIHECPTDFGCVPFGHKDDLEYQYLPQIIPFTPAAPAPTPPSLLPITLVPGVTIDAKAPAAALGNSTYAYFTYHVPDPCDDVTVEVHLHSGFADAVFMSPKAIATHAKESSLGWMMALTNQSEHVHANHHDEYNVSPPVLSPCVPSLVDNTCTTPKPHYGGKFTIMHGYMSPELTIGVRCFHADGCHFNISASSVSHTKQLAQTTSMVPTAIKWFHVCISEMRGLQVVARLLPTTSAASVSRIGFYVSRSRIDHPKNVSTAGHMWSPLNNSSSDSIIRNQFKEAYWLNPGFELHNASAPNVTRFSDETITLCPWMAGFSTGAYFIGVFSKCTNDSSPLCYSGNIEYTIMASSVENSCSVPLVSNKTVSGVVPFGAYGRYHIDLPSLCTDIKVELSELGNTHPYVFLSANDSYTPSVTTPAFGSRDKQTILKQYDDRVLRGNVRTVFIAVLCNSTVEPCRFGITAFLLPLPQYWDIISYVHGDYDFENRRYEAPAAFEQLSFGLCFTQPNVRIGVETIITKREYQNYLGMRYVSSRRNTMGPLWDGGCASDRQPCQTIYNRNDYPPHWTVGHKRYEGINTTCQLWSQTPIVDSGKPLVFKASTPGWKTGFHFLSVSWSEPGIPDLATDGSEKLGVSYGMFRAWAKPWPVQSILESITDLHTPLTDGAAYHSRLLGYPPREAYFKFYVDNICKRVHIDVQGLGQLFQIYGVHAQYEIFVSNELRFPHWRSYMWHRVNPHGKALSLHLDANDPTFKVTPKDTVYHMESWNYVIRIYTTLLAQAAEVKETSVKETWGVTWDYLRWGPFTKYELCINDVQYGLDVVVTKMPIPAQKYLWPLVRISQREDQDDQPNWRNAKAYYAEQTIVPDNYTMKMTLCSGEPGFRPGIFHISINATVEGMGEVSPGLVENLYFNMKATPRKQPCSLTVFNGIPHTGIVSVNSSVFYEYNLTDPCQSLKVELISQEGDADVYVTNEDSIPSKQSLSWSSASSGNGMVVIHPGDPGHRVGKYRILITCESDEACPSKFSLNVTTIPVDSAAGFSVHGYIIPGETIRYFPVCFSWTRGLGLDFGPLPRKVLSQGLGLLFIEPTAALTVAVQAVGVDVIPRLFLTRTRYAKTLPTLRQVPGFHSRPIDALSQQIHVNIETPGMGLGMWYIGVYYECSGPDPLSVCKAPPTTTTFLLTATPKFEFLEAADRVAPPKQQPITLKPGIPFRASAVKTHSMYFRIQVSNACEDIAITVTPVESSLGLHAYISSVDSNPTAWSFMSPLLMGTNTTLEHTLQRHAQEYFVAVGSDLAATQDFVITVTMYSAAMDSLTRTGSVGNGRVEWLTICIPATQAGLNVSITSDYLLAGLCFIDLSKPGPAALTIQQQQDYSLMCKSFDKNTCVNTPTGQDFCVWIPRLPVILHRDAAHFFLTKYNAFDSTIFPSNFMDAWGLLQWRSPGLWDVVGNTSDADIRILCASCEGFEPGAYRIGVMHYCRDYVPWFAPFPRSNVAFKSRCGPSVTYNLQAHPPLAECSVPLQFSPTPSHSSLTGIKYAISASGRLQPGHYAHFDFHLPHPCLDFSVVVIAYEKSLSTIEKADPDVVLSNKDIYPELMALTWKSVEYGNDMITLNYTAEGYASGKQTIAVYCDPVKYQQNTNLNTSCSGPFAIFIHTRDKSLNMHNGVAIDEGGYTPQATDIRWYSFCRPFDNTSMSVVVQPWCDSSQPCVQTHYSPLRNPPHPQYGYKLIVGQSRGVDNIYDPWTEPTYRLSTHAHISDAMKGLSRGVVWVGVTINSTTPQPLPWGGPGYEAFPFRITINNESSPSGFMNSSKAVDYAIALQDGVPINGSVTFGKHMLYSFDSSDICQDIEIVATTVNSWTAIGGKVRIHASPPGFGDLLYHSTMQYGERNGPMPPLQPGTPAPPAWVVPPPPPPPPTTSSLSITHKAHDFKIGTWWIVVACNRTSTYDFGCPATYTLTVHKAARGKGQVSVKKTIGHGANMINWIDVCINDVEKGEANVERGFIVQLKKLSQHRTDFVRHKPQIKVQAMLTKFPNMEITNQGDPLDDISSEQTYNSLLASTFVGPGMIDATHRQDLLYTGTGDPFVSGQPNQEVDSTFVLCDGTQGFAPGYFSLGIFGICPGALQNCEPVEYQVYAHPAEGLCRRQLVDSQIVTGQVHAGKVSRYLFNLTDPCRDLHIRLRAFHGEPDVFVTRTEMAPAFRTGFNWYDYKVGNGYLVLRHTEKQFKTGMYEIAVTCDEGQECPALFDIQVFTTKSLLYANHKFSFMLEDKFASSFANMHWYPFCLTEITGTAQFNVTLSSGRGGSIVVSRYAESLDATHIEDVYGWRSNWVTDTATFAPLSLVLRPNYQHYEPGPYWVGVFSGPATSVQDAYQMDELSFIQTTNISPSYLRGHGDPLTLYLNEAVTLDITKGERHPYRFAVTDWCKDIVIDLTYRTAAVGEPDVVASFDDTDPDIPVVTVLPQMSPGWSTLHACDLPEQPINSCVVPREKNSTSVFVSVGHKRLVVSHASDAFRTDMLRIAVACIKMPECQQTYSIKISLREAPVNIFNQGHVTQGGIQWHQVCLSNVSFGLNVTTTVRNGSPALVYVSRAKALPKSQQDYVSVPMFRTQYFWGAHEKTVLSTLLCENTPGVQPGKYFIGVLAKCTPYDPTFPSKPYPGHANKMECAPSINYTLSAHPSQHLCIPEVLPRLAMGGVLFSRRCMYSWCADGRALYRYTPQQECVDLLFKVTAVAGDPDIYITAVDFDPGDQSYGWRSQQVGNDEILVSSVDSKWAGKEFRFSISCEKKYDNHTSLFYHQPRISAACPATFAVEVQEIRVADSISTVSFLSESGQAVWRPVCFNSSVKSVTMTMHIHTPGAVADPATFSLAGMIAGLAPPDVLRGDGNLCVASQSNCNDFETTFMRRVPLGTRDPSILPKGLSPSKDLNLLPSVPGTAIWSTASVGSFVLGRGWNHTDVSNESAIPRGIYHAGVFLAASKRLTESLAWGDAPLSSPAIYRLQVTPWYLQNAAPPRPPADEIRHPNPARDDPRRVYVTTIDKWYHVRWDKIAWEGAGTEQWYGLKDRIRMCTYHETDVTDICSDVHITAQPKAMLVTEQSPSVHMTLAASFTDRYPSTDGMSWLGKYPTSEGGEYMLRIRAGDPLFHRGKLYFSMCCVITPCTMNYQIKVSLSLGSATSDALIQQEITGDVQKQQIIWYPVCIRDTTSGLNLTATLVNSFSDPEPHFMVTKEWQQLLIGQSQSRTGALRQSTWMSPGFWYQWRGLHPNTDSLDQKVFCKSTPGFLPGMYYVGVFTKCHVTVPYFPSIPYPDYAKKGSVCNGGTAFKLQSTTSNTACHIPILHDVPLSGTVNKGDYAWFRFNASDVCQDITVRVVTVTGEPDLYISTTDFPLNTLGFSWHSKSIANDLITVSRSAQKFTPGFYYIAVHCHNMSACPASFSLQVATSYPSPTDFSDSSYTTHSGKIRWYQSCARTYLEALDIRALPRRGTDGNIVVSQFQGPDRYDMTWMGGAWREEFSKQTISSTLPYRYTIAHNHSGFVPGVYYIGVDFHDVPGRDTDSTIHLVVNSFYISCQRHDVAAYRPPQLIPGQFGGVFNTAVCRVNKARPCPPNSHFDPLSAQNMPWEKYGSWKCCICNSGYNGVQPDDIGYDPENPACREYKPVSRFYRCEMWKNCASPFYCGLYVDNMCQYLKELKTNVTSVPLTFMPSSTYLYDYYTYNITSACVDVWFTVNASVGIPAMLVATTGDELSITETTLGWTSNTYDESVKTIKISNQDHGFPLEKGTFYVAVSCFRECPQGLAYTIEVKEFPKADIVVGTHQIIENMISWVPICAMSDENGLHTMVRGPYASSSVDPCPGLECPVTPCVDDPEGLIAGTGVSVLSVCGVLNASCESFSRHTYSGQWRDTKRLCPQTCNSCRTWDCTDETLHGLRGSGYRGCQNRTVTGLSCVNWESKNPNDYLYTPVHFPNSNLNRHNYCRNPSVAEEHITTIWCYVDSATKEWDYCSPIGIETETPMIYVTYNEPGPIHFDDAFPMPSWKGRDIFYALGKDGAGIDSISPPGTSQIRFGRGSPAFKKGMYFVGLYMPCGNTCKGKSWAVYLIARRADADFTRLYNNGLFIEFVLQCAVNPNTQDRGNHKCLLNREKVSNALAMYGLTEKAAIARVITTLDINADQLLSWYELSNTRLDVLGRVGSYDMHLPATSMLTRPPPSTWHNGVVQEGEYMYYEQYLDRCQAMCVMTRGLSGQADLYISPPPEERPTVKSATWFSRMVQSNSICIDPETPGFEPGIFRIAVHCGIGYDCPAHFMIRFQVTSFQKDFVKVQNVQVSESSEIHWYKLCNAQTPVVQTIYPVSGANAAARGNKQCKFPFIYKGRVFTRCITGGMPYKWCYHADGTWGQCNFEYAHRIEDQRPSYVATLQNEDSMDTAGGLGATRIIALSSNPSRPTTRGAGFDIAAIRPSHYGQEQALMVPPEDTTSGGMVYIGIYAACAKCAGKYNLTVHKRLVQDRRSGRRGGNMDSSAVSHENERQNIVLNPGQSYTNWATNDGKQAPASMFFTLLFTPNCLDLVIEITTPAISPAPNGVEPSGSPVLPVPRLYLSQDHIRPMPSHKSFSSDLPLNSLHFPLYIPFAMKREASTRENRVWVSHQSPDFNPGHWYLGVHCVSDDPTKIASCSETYTIRYLHPVRGNYPREMTLGDPVSMIGRTKKGHDPEPFSICVEVDELGVQISAQWLPSLNATIEEQKAKASVRGDYVSPPDPTTTPFFVMARSREAFRQISSSSQAPVFLSNQFQKGPLEAANSTDTWTMDTLTMCSQVAVVLFSIKLSVWYIGVFPYCMLYERYTFFQPYPGFSKQVACLPWYIDGEQDPGLRFQLNTALLEPKCENDCTSSVTYTRTIGPEKHGRCFGCRGTCLCDKYWSGESCGAAECLYDNCLGHGVCSSDGVNAIGTGTVLADSDKFDCVCDPGYQGVNCADKMQEECPSGCFGQGNCEYGWRNEPSNITVGSCHCVMDYIGHECSFVKDKKLETSFMAASIYVALFFVGACILVSIRVTQFNAVEDARDEYDMLRHANPVFVARAESKTADKDLDEDDDMGFDDENVESDESEDWPDERDWRPKNRKAVRNDGKVSADDIGVRKKVVQ